MLASIRNRRFIKAVTGKPRTVNQDGADEREPLLTGESEIDESSSTPLSTGSFPPLAVASKLLINSLTIGEPRPEAGPEPQEPLSTGEQSNDRIVPTPLPTGACSPICMSEKSWLTFLLCVPDSSSTGAVFDAIR